MVDEHVLKILDLGQVCLMRLLIVLWEMFQVQTKSATLVKTRDTRKNCPISRPPSKCRIE